MTQNTHGLPGSLVWRGKIYLTSFTTSTTLILRRPKVLKPFSRHLRNRSYRAFCRRVSSSSPWSKTTATQRIERGHRVCKFRDHWQSEPHWYTSVGAWHPALSHQLPRLPCSILYLISPPRTSLAPIASRLCSVRRWRQWRIKQKAYLWYYWEIKSSKYWDLYSWWYHAWSRWTETTGDAQ